MDKYIYITDTEKNTRKLEKIYLEKSGFVVDVFDTGDDLLEMFEKSLRIYWS